MFHTSNIQNECVTTLQQKTPHKNPKKHWASNKGMLFQVKKRYMKGQWRKSSIQQQVTIDILRLAERSADQQ